MLVEEIKFSSLFLSKNMNALSVQKNLTIGSTSFDHRTRGAVGEGL